MFQVKAQRAGNGSSFSRAATQDWDIWVAPFGRAGKRSSVALHLWPRTRPLPARRALRPTTSQLAEPVIIMLKEYLYSVNSCSGRLFTIILGFICLGFVCFNGLLFRFRQIQGAALSAGRQEEHHGHQEQLSFNSSLDSIHVQIERCQG